VWWRGAKWWLETDSEIKTELRVSAGEILRPLLAGAPQPELQKKYGLKDFVVIQEEKDENGYNGFVFFDKVKASMPLVR
jgi:hypothetical protein